MTNSCNSTFCFTMFLRNVINTTVISVDHIGVVPWCIIWWFIWFLVHTVYKKCFQALLERISLQEDHSKQLIRLYWSIAFTSITVPFAMQNLKIDYSDVIDRFYYVLENHISSWFLTDPVSSVQTKLSYVILAGFYLNNICEVCFEFDLYSKEFIMNELIGLFFIATFPLRCVQYGLAVTTVINVVDFALSLSKLISCFCDIAQTKSLRVFSYVFLFFHTILWFYAYLHILPSYLIYESLKKMEQGSDIRQISMFLLLNCSLITHYIFVLATSPVTVMILNFLRNKSIYVFARKTSEPYIEEMSAEEKEKTERIIRKRENLRMLYHTVKCVVRIKKKLAKIRQDKKTETENNCDEGMCIEEEIDDVGSEYAPESTIDNIEVSFSCRNGHSLENKSEDEHRCYDEQSEKCDVNLSGDEEISDDDRLNLENKISS